MSYTLSTEKTWAATLDDLGETFRKWGIRNWSVMPSRPMSRARWQNTEDRRVTVRYVPRKDGDEITLTMDVQNRAEDNLRVLYLAIEALRMNEARGIADLVREAYLQLPAPAKTRDPYEVLGVRPDAPAEVIDSAYRALAKQRHPDAGGTDDAMTELNEARDRIAQDRNHA